MPRIKKTAAKPAAPKKESPAGLPEAAAEVRKTPPALPPREELYKMIQTAAFFKAEKDKFQKEPHIYWAEAETEIMARYG